MGDVAEIQSTQKVADICLLLHALHAARTGLKAVIVTSEDTDVILLCLPFQNDILCPVKCVYTDNCRIVLCHQTFCGTSIVVSTLLGCVCRIRCSQHGA